MDYHSKVYKRLKPNIKEIEKINIQKVKYHDTFSGPLFSVQLTIHNDIDNDNPILNPILNTILKPIFNPIFNP